MEQVKYILVSTEFFERILNFLLTVFFPPF